MRGMLIYSKHFQLSTHFNPECLYAHPKKVLAVFPIPVRRDFLYGWMDWDNPVFAGLSFYSPFKIPFFQISFHFCICCNSEPTIAHRIQVDFTTFFLRLQEQEEILWILKM